MFADSLDVGGGAAFADVLDDALGTHDGRHIPPPAPSGSGSRPVTPPLFPFVGPGVRFHATPYAALRRHSAARIGRPLTGFERRALAALNALGAGLDETTMSQADLRHAFRRLARHYHPDRHPASSEAEKAWLSRIFADLTGQYRLLAAAFSRA